MDRRALPSHLERGVDLPSDENIRTRLLALSESSGQSMRTAEDQEAIIYLTEGQATVTVGRLGGTLQANEFVHVPVHTAYSVTATGGSAAFLLFEMPGR